MSKIVKSAKDAAFEKERARMRHEYNIQIADLQKILNERNREILRLRDCLTEAESRLQEKEDWINRLLEYMDLSREELKTILEKEKERAELSEHFKVLFCGIEKMLDH